VEVAIGITAIVHFTNNLFKLGLMGLKADKGVIFRFGIPAIISAVAGALVLAWLSDLRPLMEYSWMGRTFQIMPIKLIIGAIILVIVLLELSPSFSSIALDKKFMPLGGCISGFFGGLSGHQGAFRSMFLIKARLDKESFVATGVVLAVMIDFSRLIIYGWETAGAQKDIDWMLVSVACVAAFAGAFAGSRLLKKMTFRVVQVIVTTLLIIVALGLMTGVL
jgi:uncharacterized membrane protein YfcA